MASNTEILIKRSFATATPANLAAGELAYSYTSNNLFIGTPDGVSALEIGGFKNFPITAGQYGSTTAIPVLRISANGLVTNVTTSPIASTLNISGDTGTDGINLLTETLAFAGGDGLTSAVTANTVTFNVDSTVIRGNTSLTTQYIDSDLQISGNLVVLGTETIINVDTLTVNDPLLQLAANNTSDIVDIGFLGHYNDGTAKHTGFYRHAGDKLYYLFSDYTAEPTANTIPPFSSGFTLATLRANLTANTSNVLNVLTLQNGSQLYANGNAYFANAPYLDGGATLDDNLVVNSAKRLRLKNNDNSAIVDIYNDGGANTNLLYVNSDIETSRNLYVANRIYGNLSNNTLYLVPSANYAPEVNDQYIIIDPTASNHIHVRAGGAIDASTAELYLGGEQTNVNVSDTFDSVYIRANNNHVWQFANTGKLILPNGNQIYDVLGNIYISSPTTTFSGNVTANGATLNGNLVVNSANRLQLKNSDNSATLDLYNTGSAGSNMFYVDSNESTFDGNVTVNSITVNQVLSVSGGVFAPNIPNARTGNLVYFDTANGRFSYADDNALTPTSIANGAFSLSIQSTNGLLVHNGSGIQLANGAIIKDTAGDAVAFGQNAGTITQGLQAVAIGDSAGYNNQGAYGVAIGYGAGNVNQGQTAVAIGINAGISNQGAYGVAIGNSAGSAQGQYGIALGYDTGGSQGADSIAIGTQAGKGNTTAIGINSIAIGKFAGFESAAASSIILNASGSNLSPSTSGFFVNPVRYTETQDATYDGLAFYNSNTKEIRYSYILDGGAF
jgi:hypothetical protein